MSTQEPTKWSCPHCPWEQRAHPVYGWAEHDERSVKVHLSMLCRGLDSPADLVHHYGYCRSLTWCASCEESGGPAGAPEAFDCASGRHDWMRRGADSDCWQECWLCGVIQEDQAHSIESQVRSIITSYAEPVTSAGRASLDETVTALMRLLSPASTEVRDA